MMTLQNKRDILELYCEGYSRRELYDIFAGLDPRDIDNVCDEYDHSWGLK